MRSKKTQRRTQTEDKPIYMETFGDFANTCQSAVRSPIRHKAGTKVGFYLPTYKEQATSISKYAKAGFNTHQIEKNSPEKK